MSVMENVLRFAEMFRNVFCFSFFFLIRKKGIRHITTSQTQQFVQMIHTHLLQSMDRATSKTMKRSYGKSPWTISQWQEASSESDLPRDPPTWHRFKFGHERHCIYGPNPYSSIHSLLFFIRRSSTQRQWLAYFQMVRFSTVLDRHSPPNHKLCSCPS